MLQNKKKWLAVLLAATLCMSATSASVVMADDEEDAATDTSTSDSEETTEDGEEEEEESKRTEETEEVEITADQVTKYMDKLNSTEGITFYHRSEDYKDEIQDEDIQDLLKHVELAGIDDKTGKVVCTLEEEDDNDDFVIFLSDKGRWLVYTDPEYKKVTMVRKIVSTLDSEYLFLSMDNKTLELYNDDFDEVVHSFTTDGKTADGKVTYTGEDNWTATLSSSYDALISMARFVTENDKLALYVNDENGVIGLYDKTKQKMWWSTPENVGHDSVATGTIVSDLSSSLKMVYGEPDARSTSTMRSDGDAKITVKDTSDGVKITYKFSKAGITVPVTYTLGEDYLESRIETEEIEEEDSSSSGKIVTTLSMMASFGAASSTDEGYFVIPDGSGALIRFNNGKTDSKSYTGHVYGSDVTAVPTTEAAVTQQVSLPMYGIVNGSDAMMVVCTEGDSNVNLEASVSGQSKSSYNICGFDFTVRDTDTYYMSGDTGTALTVFEDGAIKTPTLAVRYYPLEDDNADYTTVAEAYRNYLTTEGNVSTTAESDTELSLNLYGGVDKEKSVLGIPITVKNPLTKFEEAQDILSDLNADGVDKMQVQYYNWTNNGISGKIDDTAKPSGKLGGKKAWKNLLSFASSNNITITPVSDDETFQSGNGYYSFSDTAVRISGSYARIYDYNLAYGTQLTDGDARSLLSPTSFGDLYSDLANAYAKADLTSISLGSMTTALYGSYGKKAVSRDAAQEELTASYQTLNDKGISIVAENANAYALPYVSSLYDIPLQSSGFDVFDEDIPFYQMVMHGVKNYASTAINGESNTTDAVLTAIAWGSDLSYDMIAAETSETMDTDLSWLYYSNADNWKTGAAGAYKLQSTVLRGLGQETITDYSREGNVMTTTYSDGTTVVTDLDADTITVNGTAYNAADYLEGSVN